MAGDEEERGGRQTAGRSGKEAGQQPPDKAGGDQQEDPFVPPAQRSSRKLQRQRPEELTRPGDQVMEGRAGKGFAPGSRAKPRRPIVGAVRIDPPQQEVTGKLRLVSAVADQRRWGGDGV